MADGTYITKVEAKAHLRVDFSDDDTYIDDLIALVEQLVLVEIAGSKDGEGTVETAASKILIGTDTNFTDYVNGDTITVLGESTRTIDVISNDTELTVTENFTNTASGLTYIMHAGIPGGTSATIPKGLKQAMLLMIGHFYMNRESVSVTTITEIPFGYKYLIAPFKNYTIA